MKNRGDIGYGSREKRREWSVVSTRDKVVGGLRLGTTMVSELEKRMTFQ